MTFSIKTTDWNVKLIPEVECPQDVINLLECLAERCSTLKGEANGCSVD